MASPLLIYDPTVAPGTELPQQDGTVLRAVEPEVFFVAMLGERMNASLVFLSANTPNRVPRDRMSAVDDAIARAYWDTYLGCLMPPKVVSIIEKAAVGPSKHILLDSLEHARRELFAAPTLDDAVEAHASVRLQVLLQGTERYLTELQTAVGELVVDYLLLQRAIAEDVRRAERERQPGETRAAVLERYDRAAELEFEKMIGLVLRPQRIVDLMPPERRGAIEAFARRRPPIFKQGVFATLAGGVNAGSGNGGPAGG